MEKQSSDHFTLGVSAIILASVLSSLGWVFEGEAVKRIAPLPTVCVSLIIGGFFQIIFAYLIGHRPSAAARSISLTRFILFSIARCSLLGLLFAVCLTLTSSSKAMFLTKIEPYIVLIIQMVLYGHRTTPQHVALLAVHLVGAVCLSTGGDISFSKDILGDILIFLGVVCNALLYQPSHHYSQKLGSLITSGSSQLIGGLVLFPWMLLFGTEAFTLTESNLIGWWYVLLTILVFYIFSTGLWFYSLKSVPAWLASALRCAGPVVAAPCAWLFFDQHFTLLQILGAVAVIATSALMVIIERRDAQRSCND